MTNLDAAKIGARYSFITLSIALVLALFLFTWLGGGGASWSHNFLSTLGFIKEFAASFAASLLGLGLSGYFLGSWAGVKILIHKTPYARIGIAVALLTLLTGTFLGGAATLLTETLSRQSYHQAWQLSDLPNGIFDYIVKPLYWIFLFGTLPAIIMGWVYARQIYKISQKIERNELNNFR